uniref:Major latex allergen Hev b 5-like n=1 Tax=Strongyloides stercoralis TaxID=6248 RepID=A0A0K0E8J6_STRER
MATLKRKNEEAIADDDNAKVIKIDEEVLNVEKENTEETAEETTEVEEDSVEDAEESPDTEENVEEVDEDSQPSVDNVSDEDASREGDADASAPEGTSVVESVPRTDDSSSVSDAETPNLPTPEVSEETAEEAPVGNEAVSNVEESSVVEPVS